MDGAAAQAPSFAERGTHRIAYEVRGDAKAPPVLLAMGMAFSSRAWDKLPGRLVDEGFRVITFDNRGTGRSTLGRGLFRVRDMADDAAAVLDAAGVARAHVFGVSMGGMTALELAINHGARVATLALGCTFAGWLRSTKPALSITRSVMSSSVDRERSLERAAPVLVSDHTWHNDRPRFADWIQIAERAPPSTVRLQMLAVLRHDTARRLRDITVPTLVVTGDVDRLVPPENSRVLARAIRNAELVEVEGAAHCFPFERLDETTAHLKRLFARAPL
jgi:3-oxoadipate enol-lactonase